MKLKFKKNNDQDISVVHVTDDGERSYSYVEMIQHLVAMGTMVEPEFEGDFTDAEKNSAASMSTHINEALAELRGD